MIDTGVSCHKKNYGRGAGVSLGCADDEVEVENLSQICYNQCPHNMFSCEGTCTENKEECTAILSDITLNIA